MYKCLIVEDEPVARELLQTYCHHLPFLELVKSCENALEAKLVMQTQAIDILFLDINLPVLNGLALLKTIPQPPATILTTAYKEFGVAAFDLSVCDYLLKPYSLERFIVAVDKAIEKTGNKPLRTEGPSGNEQDSFFIKSNGKILQVKHDEFLFAEAQGNYTQIYLSGYHTLANISFSVFEGLLPKSNFIRVHRSFIINTSKINRIEGNRIYIGKKEIPIGASYKGLLYKRIGIQP